MSDEQIERVLRQMVLDEPDHGLTADHFVRDPRAWRLAAEDWGLSTRHLRTSPAEAQEDAEACRAALVDAGWVDQARAEVSAFSNDPAAGTWRGSLNVSWALLPPMPTSAAPVAYQRVEQE